jgi:UDP-N-acetylglucosamine 2-epimerase (non-hydrolysing)
MIDALMTVLPTVDKCDISSEIGFAPARRYGVVTLHRPSNVDDPLALETIVEKLCEIAKEVQLIFPLHPRTKRWLDSGASADRLRSAGVRLISPLSYIPFISLIQQASFLLTDSGGVQEESSVLGVPCLTLRASTERPITIVKGTNRLITTDDLVAAVREALVTQRRPAEIEFWDGNTAHRIAASLRKAAGVAQ